MSIVTVSLAKKVSIEAQTLCIFGLIEEKIFGHRRS